MLGLGVAGCLHRVSAASGAVLGLGVLEGVRFVISYMSGLLLFIYELFARVFIGPKVDLACKS